MSDMPIDTNRTLEEIERSIEIEKKKSAKLKDWPNVDKIYPDEEDDKDDE